MLEKSLNKLRHRVERYRKKSDVPGSKKEKHNYSWLFLIYLPAWVLFSFIASIYIVAGIAGLLDWLNLSLSSLFNATVYQTILSTIVYVLSLVLAIGIPYWLLRNKTSLADLGLKRLISWTDIGLTPVTFVVYILTAEIILGLVLAVYPGFPIEQVQDIGYSPFGSPLDNTLAFLMLVVIAPFAEEVLFRGYLYGKLKTYVPVVLAAVVTSLLFGLIHFQWNVAIDVFVLSMFLCGLRSLTGSIWAGVLVHMTKNGVAYMIFMNPFLGG